MSSYFNLIDTEILDKKIETEKFPFSKYLFWDSEVGDLDVKQHKKHIIERVLTRGFLKDVYILFKIYSKDELTTAIKSSRVLDKKTANFCHLYFNIPKEDISACAIKDYSNYHLSIYYSFNILKAL
jgi:hypothetical protein